LQAGQTKPFGQRFSKRWAAQAASSGNRLLKAVRDIGRSYFRRLPMRTKKERADRRSSGESATYRAAGTNGISHLSILSKWHVAEDRSIQRYQSGFSNNLEEEFDAPFASIASAPTASTSNRSYSRDAHFEAGERGIER